MISTALAWLSGIRADHKTHHLRGRCAASGRLEPIPPLRRIRRQCRRLQKFWGDAPFDIKQTFTFDQRF